MQQHDVPQLSQETEFHFQNDGSISTSSEMQHEKAEHTLNPQAQPHSVSGTHMVEELTSRPIST